MKISITEHNRFVLCWVVPEIGSVIIGRQNKPFLNWLNVVGLQLENYYVYSKRTENIP